MISLVEARRRWASAQQLDAQSTDAVAAVVAQTGWLRTLGGSEAYLAIAARRPQTLAEEVHAAVSTRALQVLPCVRGCIYLVPECDATLALSASRMLDGRRFERDLAKAETSAAELSEVGAAVLALVAEEPCTTRELRTRLPGGVLRSLGAAGKKVGLSSTLPPALRQLEWSGRLSRRPHNNQLDHEVYVWHAVEEPRDLLDSEHAIAAGLAARYFRWAGLGTLDGFVAWSGLGKRLAKAAVAGLALTAVDVETVGPMLAAPEGPQGSDPDRLVALPGLDNLLALQPTSPAFVEAAHHHRVVNLFAGMGSGPIGTRKNVNERLLVRRGEVVGAWAWDPASQEIVAVGLGGQAPTDAPAALAAASRIFRELGHGRSMGMDSDERLLRRLALVEELAVP